jgi:hypothetical protein
LIGTLNVAPEAVVIPTLVPPLIHPVSGRPSPSTSMTCLVTAPAGTPVPAGAHPEDSAVAGVVAVPALVAPEAVVDAVPVVGWADELAVVVTGPGAADWLEPQALSASPPNSAAATAAEVRVRIAFSKPWSRNLYVTVRLPNVVPNCGVARYLGGRHTEPGWQTRRWQQK